MGEEMGEGEEVLLPSLRLLLPLKMSRRRRGLSLLHEGGCVSTSLSPPHSQSFSP